MQNNDIRDRQKVLWSSTINFTLMFAVWLMFAVLGVPIKKEMGLTDVQFGWLTALPILNGAIWRLAFGLLTDRLGGRLVMTALMIFTAIPVALVTFAQSYSQLLLAAFFIGFAGNSFSVGVAWNSAWFPSDKQGGALGLFGAGNVGASITKLCVPLLLASVPAAGIAGLTSWRVVPPIYAVVLLVAAILMFLNVPAEDKTPATGRPLSDLLKPLARVQVWRFSLYYVVVFGAYVALSSWLPKFYVEHYKISLTEAGLLTSFFIFPASLLRPLGGVLSDKWGGRGLLYATFGLMTAALTPLWLVPMSVMPFTLLLITVGVAMGIGKAAVFRMIPTWYPQEVGAVGGLVGMLGALGGFFLTPTFAYVKVATHTPLSVFGVVELVSVVSLAWLHLSVVGIKRREAVESQSTFGLGMAEAEGAG